MANDKIPNKITPDPIVSAVVEIRFKPGIPQTAVVGSVYSKLANNYPNYKNLPFPQEFKRMIPNLKYTAEIEIANEDYTLGIGHNVFSQRINNKYLGWKDFFAICKQNVETLTTIPNLIEKTERIGLRYINFFPDETDMFNSFRLSIEFAKKDQYDVNHTMYRTSLSTKGINLELRIEDKAKTAQTAEGLLLDIDANSTNEDDLKGDLLKIIDTLHVEEKILFFNLLTDEFLSKFKPKYGDKL